MNYKEFKPDADVLMKIAREQQETLKKFDESFKEGVEIFAQAIVQIKEAQESEAVWKTEWDKADQRRIEAEARLAEAELLIQRGHDGWQKAEAEVAFWKSKAHEAEDREGKLEAEVERLRDKLRLAVMLAEEVADEWVDPDFCGDSPEFIRLRARIDQIKAALNNTDK